MQIPLAHINRVEYKRDMNAETRKNLSLQISTLEQVIADLEAFRDAEQEKYDNMTEGLQNGEKGQAIYSAIDALQSACDAADSCKSYIDDAISQ